MAQPIVKPALFDDLRTRISAHQSTVMALFAPLAGDQLAWKPSPKEWSILQCFDHLDLTHAFYAARLDRAVVQPAPARPADDAYRPSFWGGIYLAVAFNPRFSFPAPGPSVPRAELGPDVLERFLARQQTLLDRIAHAAGSDLSRTRVPLGAGVHFNLGDCFIALVHHDRLHLNQALDVRARLPAANWSTD
jgi:hypothetical protein